MSVAYYIYLGPYIEINIKPIKIYEKRRVCPGQKCKINKLEKEKKWKFCPECGLAIEEHTFEVDKTPDWFEFSSAHDLCDIFTSINDVYSNNKTNSILLIPQDCDFLKRECYWDVISSNINLSLPSNIILSEITLFCSEFENKFDYIGLIKEHFGAKNVNIKWGILSNVF